MLAAVASIALLIAILTSWAESTVFNSEEFADRAVAALNSASVRQALAERITDALSGQSIGSLTSFRPAILAIVEELETTEAFRSIFHDAVEQTHRAVFERHAARALLQLGDLLTILTSTAQQTNTDLASRLPIQSQFALDRRHASGPAAQAVAGRGRRPLDRRVGVGLRRGRRGRSPRGRAAAGDDRQLGLGWRARVASWCSSPPGSSLGRPLADMGPQPGPGCARNRFRTSSPTSWPSVCGRCLSA